MKQHCIRHIHDFDDGVCPLCVKDDLEYTKRTFSTHDLQTLKGNIRENAVMLLERMLPMGWTSRHINKGSIITMDFVLYRANIVYEDDVVVNVWVG